MARPTIDPDWAENLVVDPTSGQNNRVEPPAAWKNEGWSYQEKPPRNYDNYMKWLFGQWIKYLDAVGVRPATYFIAASNADEETKRHADAVCDGVDDQAEINAAIAYVINAANNPSQVGMVLLSEGTFTLSGSVVMETGIQLRGQGARATTLFLDGAVVANLSMIDITGKANCQVRDLRVDGNDAAVNNNTVGVEVTSSADVDIENVDVYSISYNSNGQGILIDGCERVRVANSHLVNVEGIAIDIQDLAGPGSYISVVDCHIRNCDSLGVRCDSDYSSLHGCRIDGNGTALTHHAVEWSASYGLIRGNIMLGNAGDGLKVTGGYNIGGENLIQNNGVHGIEIDDDNNHFSDNQIVQNSQAATNTYDGIYLTASATNNTITDNKVRGGTIGNTQRYGVNSLAPAPANFIYSNDLVASGTTSSTNTVAGEKTIPRWTGSGAAANAQDSITNANRVAP